MIGPVRRNIGGNVVAALANFLGGITVLLEVACEFCEQFRASSVPTVGDSRLASVIEILDSLGDSASKIWNVARWTADRIWNAEKQTTQGSDRRNSTGDARFNLSHAQ